MIEECAKRKSLALVGSIWMDQLLEQGGRDCKKSIASTNGDATPPSPKIAKLMAEMIKLGDQKRRMSYENEERMERMRKENEESLERICRSSEALSLRIENIEQRREDKSSNSSHGEDKGD
ncbi:hypothetical protein GmHk_02G004925 [Glycine max]|nr:hypothetical protein GmHk_02G004925 [Glycine max]